MRAAASPLDFESSVRDLQSIRDLRIEADGLEALYGPNLYSKYLKQFGRRPDRQAAATMGRLMGGRVKADDGSLQPPPVSKRALSTNRALARK